MERKIAIAELVDGISSGQVAELFACGTAAAVIAYRDAQGRGRDLRRQRRRDGGDHRSLRKSLLDIQYGRAADTHGWLRRVL